MEFKRLKILEATDMIEKYNPGIYPKSILYSRRNLSHEKAVPIIMEMYQREGPEIPGTSANSYWKLIAQFRNKSENNQRLKP